MSSYIKYLTEVLVFLGICFLSFGFYEGLKYAKFISAKRVARYWKYSVGLVGFFIFGYLIYFVYLILRKEVFSADLLISIVFFFGSLYVFFTAGAGVAFIDEIKKYVSQLEKEKNLLVDRIREKTQEMLAVNNELKKVNKKLEEVDEMRKNFVSYTAHELRAPLNTFRWSLEMLRNENLGKINLKQREILDQIYKENLRLLDLANDLLDVTRIDEAKLKLKPLPCQIEDIIDEVAGNFAVKIREKRIQFVWRRGGQPLPKIMGDKDRLRQVVWNIISNAIKFTPAGKKIEIKASVVDKVAPSQIIKKFGFKEEKKKYVRVSFSDQGIGIPKAERGKIFDRFFRASNVDKTKTPGTGLGLFIVLELIKMCDGGVWFESEEGKGTTFYITLPVA